MGTILGFLVVPEVWSTRHTSKGRWTFWSLKKRPSPTRLCRNCMWICMYIYIYIYISKNHRHYTRLISIESETYLPCFLFKQKIQQLHYSTYLNTSLRKHLKPIPRFCSLLEKTGAKGTIGAPCVAKARVHASRFPKEDPTCVKCLWNPPPESFSVAVCKEQGNYRFTSHHGYPICSMYGIFTTPS